MFQIIVRVYAEGVVTEVPVTPDTTCRDVIECIRDPGDENCCLVETWCGGCGEYIHVYNIQLQYMCCRLPADNSQTLFRAASLAGVVDLCGFPSRIVHAII